jgi:hypothetical protein
VLGEPVGLELDDALVLDLLDQDVLGGAVGVDGVEVLAAGAGEGVDGAVVEEGDVGDELCPAVADARGEPRQLVRVAVAAGELGEEVVQRLAVGERVGVVGGGAGDEDVVAVAGVDRVVALQPRTVSSPLRALIVSPLFVPMIVSGPLVPVSVAASATDAVAAQTRTARQSDFLKGVIGRTSFHL